MLWRIQSFGKEYNQDKVCFFLIVIFEKEAEQVINASSALIDYAEGANNFHKDL